MRPFCSRAQWEAIRDAAIDALAPSLAGTTLRSAALAVLCQPDGLEKARLTFATAHAFNTGALVLPPEFASAEGEGASADADAPSPPDHPARPSDVTMVPPAAVKSNSRLQKLHALVHAESYAIDLSWDMVVRFGYSPTLWTRFEMAPVVGGPDGAASAAAAAAVRTGVSSSDGASDTARPLSTPSSRASGTDCEMAAPWHGRRRLPTSFFADWVRVAAEEAKHFTRWRLRLEELGSHYGAFTAHTGTVILTWWLASCCCDSV